MKFVTCLLVASAAIATPALAQLKDKPDAVYHYDSNGTYDDEIIVIAPSVSSERSASGARIETIRASRSVSLVGLDLRHDADVEELRARVRATALEACNDLEYQSRGIVTTRTHECVRDAQENAAAEVNEMIWRARG